MAEPKQKKGTAVTDPLEASKIQSKPAVQVASTEVEEAAPVVVVADPVVTSPVVKYKVAATTIISLNGQITKLNAEDVISEESYGPSTMAKILASNVPLVKVSP